MANGCHLTVEESTDRMALREILMRVPEENGYLLGDLDYPFFKQSRWFVASHKEHQLAIVLLYEGLNEPCLLSAGSAEGVAEIFRRVSPDLPFEGWAKVPEAHRHGWELAVRLSKISHDQIMALDLTLFQLQNTAHLVTELSLDDFPEMENFFSNYPGNFFEISQVRDGRHVGAYVDGKLVSIAGTHVLSKEGGSAVLANIVTDADYRRRGLASTCTSHLINLLFSDGIEHITLQVASDNNPAIACYKHLGFTFVSNVFQAYYVVRINEETQ